MIIFLAGNTENKMEAWLPTVYPARLRTYVEERVRNRPRHPIMFLDSGAFTFRRTNEVVPLETYAKFVMEYKAQISSSMDVIGDYKKTDDNYKLLRSMGANVTPVMHSNWTKKQIETYVEQHEFILAGGMVPYAKQPEKLYPFLDTVFSVAKKYWPRKIHAFGITGDKILRRYPFYSADSTAWLTYAKFGRSLKGETPLLNYVGKMDRSHDKLRGEAIEMVARAKEWTDLWKRRGIVWDDPMSTLFNNGIGVN